MTPVQIGALAMSAGPCKSALSSPMALFAIFKNFLPKTPCLLQSAGRHLKKEICFLLGIMHPQTLQQR
jgi:hypothetical protein